MKKLILKRILACSLSLSCLFSGVINYAGAFRSETHEYTTGRGIKILESKKGEECSEIYNEEAKEQIMKSCTKPDFDEAQGAFKHHFYNTLTEKNSVGEDDSALSRCVMHYENALSNFKDNLQKKSFDELGRSIHFLEDLNTPVHTNNQTFIDTAINVSLHVSFENRCKDIQSNVVSSMSEKEFEYYKNNSVETIAKASAYLANDNLYALVENNLERDTVVKNSIENAQKAVAGLLYKFYTDVC